MTTSTSTSTSELIAKSGIFGPDTKVSKRIGTGTYGSVYSVETPYGKFAVKRLYDYETKPGIIGEPNLNIINELMVISRCVAFGEDRVRRFICLAYGVMNFGELGGCGWLLPMPLFDCSLYKFTISTPYLIDAQFIESVYRDISAGLMILHNLGIIHSDIKPANILVENVGGIGGGTVAKYRFLLTDFSISIRYSREKEYDTYTDSSEGYCSPALLNNHIASPQNDFWALGKVLYDMCGPFLKHIRHHDSFEFPGEWSQYRIYKFKGYVKAINEQLDDLAFSAQFLRDLAMMLDGNFVGTGALGVWADVGGWEGIYPEVDGEGNFVKKQWVDSKLDVAELKRTLVSKGYLDTWRIWECGRVYKNFGISYGKFRNTRLEGSVKCFYLSPVVSKCARKIISRYLCLKGRGIVDLFARGTGVLLEDAYSCLEAVAFCMAFSMYQLDSETITNVYFGKLKPEHIRDLFQDVVMTVGGCMI